MLLAAGATPEEIMEMLKLCISRGSGSHLIQSAGREERTALPTVG
jgi:alkylhydroperoxidase/carboxymuconolactone decarboxylase family protein YurZ